MRLVGLGATAAFLLLAPAALAWSQDAPSEASVVEDESDPGWPREIPKDGATLTYYQPQLDGWDDFKLLTGRMAFSLQPRTGKPVLGVASLRAKSQVDVDARMIAIKAIEVADVRFPGLNPANAAPMETLFRKLFPTTGLTISLDRVLAGLETGRAQARSVAVRNEPPPIFVSESPAILLFVDGEPARVPVVGTKLTFVANTSWPLFHDEVSKTYYLLDEETWLSAPALEAPWSATSALPAEFSKLPDDDQFADIRSAVPARAPTGPVKPVFYTATPAELIELDGKPVYADLPETQLAYAQNTDNDLFLHKDELQYYVLLSGRWFRSASLTGPWSYASADLPTDFAKIPRDSEAASVLASVPGTQEAADAVLLALVPQTAIVTRAEVEKDVKVDYAGEPKFVAIEQSPVSYAVNTESKVLLFEKTYYLCHQGIWFFSASAEGPWKVAESVPDAIYAIPPSSPVYNVTYVTVSDPTPTTVTTSYTSGYGGAYVTSVGVVYGSGWYYPPYYYYPAYYAYPIYWPYPCTYGVGARYNPYTGAYGVGRAAYGPYGAAGGAAAYNPSTGRYSRAATVQGAYGGRSAASSYNPYTGVRATTRQGSSPYAQWGSTAVQRGNDWAVSNRVTTEQGSVRRTTTSGGGSATTVRGPGGDTARVVRDGDNNVYAGKDGNVYKREAGGGWQKYDGGDWSSVERPSSQRSGESSTRGEGSARTRPAVGSSRSGSAVPSDVTRDASSRQRGAARQSSAQRQRSSGVRRSGGRRGGRGRR